MRYHTEHKDQTRQAILAEAAAVIRAAGPDKVSVAAVMTGVGLTHGGFYAHFESKEDLVAQAVPVMFDDSFRHFLTHTDKVPPALALGRFIDRYLSTAHRDHPAKGCPMPSLSGELARLPAPARANFLAGVRRLTLALAALIETLDPEHAEETAASVLSELVGALTLARAVGTEADSRRVLRASRAALKCRLGLPGRDRVTASDVLTTGAKA